MDWSAFLWTALWVVVGIVGLIVIVWIIIASIAARGAKKVMDAVLKDFNDDDFPRNHGSRLR